MRILTTIICVCIPFPGPRRRLRTWLKAKFPTRQKSSALCALRRYMQGRDAIVWFDHSLGGGTETYSQNQFAALKKSGRVVIRVQYFPWAKMFGISSPNRRCKIMYMAPSLDDVYSALKDAKISQIVVNNLVGYPCSTDVLALVAAVKAASGASVSFRGHDFQAICPSFNLINCDDTFCNFEYRQGCEVCWHNKKLGDCEADNTILRSGAVSICDWRKAWGDFFSNICDEVVVFSSRIGEIFSKIYPQITDKIIVIPHHVRSLRNVHVAPHDGINIACLGYIQAVKGRDIVLDMCRHITADMKVSITIIGEMNVGGTPPAGLSILGRYRPDELPSIIEQHKIDLIFISSIWPETFSYTTAEAMSMGIPVACYDMGAPAERISKYEHGLVLSEINPQKNLQEIIEFIKHLNKEH